VFGRAVVQGLVCTAMHSQIGLGIAGQTIFTDLDAACHRPLADG
jgi:hypothetical protein